MAETAESERFEPFQKQLYESRVEEAERDGMEREPTVYSVPSGCSDPEDGNAAYRHCLLATATRESFVNSTDQSGPNISRTSAREKSLLWLGDVAGASRGTSGKMLLRIATRHRVLPMFRMRPAA